MKAALELRGGFLVEARERLARQSLIAIGATGFGSAAPAMRLPPPGMARLCWHWQPHI